MANLCARALCRGRWEAIDDLTQAALTDLCTRGELARIDSALQQSNFGGPTYREAQLEVERAVLRVRDKVLRPHRLRHRAEDLLNRGSAKTTRREPQIASLDTIGSAGNQPATAASNHADYLNAYLDLLASQSGANERLLKLMVSGHTVAEIASILELSEVDVRQRQTEIRKSLEGIRPPSSRRDRCR